MNPQQIPLQRDNSDYVIMHAGIPSWLPESIRDRIRREGNVIYVGSFSAADRKIMRTRRPVKPSKWCEEHRVITRGSRTGPWRNRTTPYLVGLMDASVFPSVRTIIVCATPQVGKSETAHNFVAYCMDRVPGDTLYVYPDIDTAKENNRDCIIPMLEASPRLREYLTGADDDLAAIRIKLQHMAIYMAWARSAARLANKPIRYVIFDEIDKYPDTAGKREASPIALGEKRTQTFRRMKKEKIWKISTPTMESAPIWQALIVEAQVVFDYWVRCPLCDGLQLMHFEQIKWPRDENGNHPDPEAVNAQKSAWYECAYCQGIWNDDRRDQAVRTGDWYARPKDWQQHPAWREDPPGLKLFQYLKKKHPAKIGFHLPSWISPFVSLSEVAAAFLKFKKSNKKDDLKDFMNGYCAEPWVIYEIERTEDAILALCDDRPRGIVPGGDIVAGLTVAADTQDNGFPYEVRAWGWGFEQESWQIREGFAPTFDALKQIFFDDVYLDPEGKVYVIQGFVIDAMGHRTKEVYDFCILNRRVFPFQGVDRLNQPHTFSQLQYYPGTHKKIPGGLHLLRANVNYYKDNLSTKLQIASGDPGAWHMHHECSRDWATQMTAEFVNENGLWECRSNMANHAWDVSVYNLVIADVIGIKYWRRPGEGNEIKKGRRVIHKGIQHAA